MRNLNFVFLLLWYFWFDDVDKKPFRFQRPLFRARFHQRLLWKRLNDRREIKKNAYRQRKRLAEIYKAQANINEIQKEKKKQQTNCKHRFIIETKCSLLNMTDLINI